MIAFIHPNAFEPRGAYVTVGIISNGVCTVYMVAVAPVSAPTYLDHMNWTTLTGVCPHIRLAGRKEGTILHAGRKALFSMLASTAEVKPVLLVPSNHSLFKGNSLEQENALLTLLADHVGTAESSAIRKALFERSNPAGVSTDHNAADAVCVH